MKKIFMVTAIMAIMAVSVFANGNDDKVYGNGKRGGQMQAGRRSGGPGQNNGGRMSGNERFSGEFTSYMSEEELKNLGSEELAGLVYMYQEEKLARDVYAELARTWNIPVFRNISESEQQHMDAIAFALEAAGQKPELMAAGSFADPKLADLYRNLLDEGKGSLASALRVGATVEDLDIADLQKAVSETGNNSLENLYRNLMKGSRNHLRSFYGQIERQGETYTAQYISADRLSEILNGERETGPFTD